MFVPCADSTATVPITQQNMSALQEADAANCHTAYRRNLLTVLRLHIITVPSRACPPVHCATLTARSQTRKLQQDDHDNSLPLRR